MFPPGVWPAADYYKGSPLLGRCLLLRINLAATTIGVASLTKELVAAYHKPPVWGCSQG